MKPRCLIIADDLTGGSDCGAEFAKNGMKTLLITPDDGESIDWSLYADIDALVINTDSRDIAPEDAYNRIIKILDDFDNINFSIIYKKIDSTLKGNLAHEIDALYEKTGKSFGLIVPSFPEQGRIMVKGLLHVNGKPLEPARMEYFLNNYHKRTTGKIEINTVNSGEGRVFDELVKHSSEGTQLVCLDAVDRKDMQCIAKAALCLPNRPILIGSAGLAKEIAIILSDSHNKINKKPNWTEHKRFSNIFFIAGSQSSVTKKQLSYIKNTGRVKIFELEPASIINDHDQEASIKKQSMAVAESLKKGHTLLQTSSRYFDEKLILKAIGKIATIALESSGIKVDQVAVLLTGGATAGMFLGMLQSKKLSIKGEISPGIVRSELEDGTWKGLNIVSKAGGFGDANDYEKIIHYLENGGDFNDSKVF